MSDKHETLMVRPISEICDECLGAMVRAALISFTDTHANLHPDARMSSILAAALYLTKEGGRFSPRRWSFLVSGRTVCDETIGDWRITVERREPLPE